MTDIAALLSTLRERDVRLWIEDDRLKCSAPEGALDTAMRTILAARKPEILAFLRQAERLKSVPDSIVPIKPGGRRPPIFAVSGHGGDVFCLLSLARHLDPEQPMFGVQPPGLDGTEPLGSLEALARYEIEQIRCYRPAGPYLIVGHCAGGTLAFEVAQQLTAAGQQVPLVALIGSPFPTSFRSMPQMLFRLGRHATALSSGSLAERRRYFMSRLQKRLHWAGATPDPIRLVDTYAIHAKANPALAGISPEVLAARQRVEDATVAAVRAYRPKPYAGRVDQFITGDKWHRSHQWRAFAPNTCEHDLRRFEVDDLLLGSDVATLAASLQQALHEVAPEPAAASPSRLPNAMETARA